MTRHERRPIDGASRGYEISADGTARKWNRLVPITKDLGGLPTVNLGKDYHGPLMGSDGNRLLDEIVCLAFHGKPPCPMKGVTVMHYDGDLRNCRVDNLAWRIDPEWLQRDHHLQILRSMPLVITKRTPASSPRPTRRTIFFES